MAQEVPIETLLIHLSSQPLPIVEALSTLVTRNRKSLLYKIAYRIVLRFAAEGRTPSIVIEHYRPGDIISKLEEAAEYRENLIWTLLSEYIHRRDPSLFNQRFTR